MNNQSEYICPICGEDSLRTDFTDGFKWGRAYCNSCDCGGPEVRTGYEESLDAPWRTEARKQFVEVVNERVDKRIHWVKTSDRLPTEADADNTMCWVLATTISSNLPMPEPIAYIRVNPDRYPYWMPIPPLSGAIGPDAGEMALNGEEGAET